MEHTRTKLLEIETQLNGAFVGRKDPIRVMLLAHLAGEHYLFVGDPGTGKTALATTFAQHVEGARYFKALLGAFTPPEKVFGALDLQAFQQGRYEYVTDGMLPTAHLAFLDEYFKAGDGLLNELLTILNEREFLGTRTPLLAVGTATNWPELEQRSDHVAALYDRTLLRCEVTDLVDQDDVVTMLECTDRVESYTPSVIITVDELRAAVREVADVSIGRQARKLLADVRERLAWKTVGGERRPAIAISARRLGKLQKVLRASAWLAGRDEVTIDDFDALRWGLWNDRADQESVNAVIDSLDEAIVTRVVSAIDAARAKFRDASKSDAPGAATLRVVAAVMRDAGVAATEAVSGGMVTASGKRQIHRAVTGLRHDIAKAREIASATGA